MKQPRAMLLTYSTKVRRKLLSHWLHYSLNNGIELNHNVTWLSWIETVYLLSALGSKTKLFSFTLSLVDRIFVLY